MLLRAMRFLVKALRLSLSLMILLSSLTNFILTSPSPPSFLPPPSSTYHQLLAEAAVKLGEFVKASGAPIAGLAISGWRLNLLRFANVAIISPRLQSLSLIVFYFLRRFLQGAVIDAAGYAWLVGAAAIAFDSIVFVCAFRNFFKGKSNKKGTAEIGGVGGVGVGGGEGEGIVDNSYDSRDLTMSSSPSGGNRRSKAKNRKAIDDAKEEYSKQMQDRIEGRINRIR